MITKEQAESAKWILKIYELEQEELSELAERQRLSDLRKKQLLCDHNGFSEYTKERESDYRTYDYQYFYCKRCTAYLAKVFTKSGFKLIISDYELVQDYRKRGYNVIDSGSRI